MPRTRKNSGQHPVHITARSHNRIRWPISLSEVWKIFEDYLWFINLNYEVKVHSFVLMPNHFHLLVTAPSGNLGQAMNYFMRETAKQINRSSGKINQVYGGPYYSSELNSFHYFMNAYKYIYQNPCRARLVGHPLDWKYSTLTGLVGFHKMCLPLETDTLLFSPNFDEKNIEWVGRSPEASAIESMRKALKRGVFKLPKDPTSKRKNSLEDNLI